MICQPWGVEYEFAHRTLRFLARRLAAEGWHALRFDYRGTGDSWGDPTVGDLDGWVEDIVQAASELRSITGLDPVDTIGLRLGATLCARASAQLGAVDSLVLWDPVLDGARWTRALEELGIPKVPGLLPPAEDELGRYRVSDQLRAELAALGGSSSPFPVGRSLLLWTQAAPRSGAWGGHGESRVEHVAQPSPWVEDVALGSGEIPVGAVARIVEWVAA